MNCIFVCIKRGDQITDNLPYKHGYFIDYLIRDEGWFPSNDAMKVFGWLRLPISKMSMVAEKVSGTETKPSSGLLRVSDLPESLSKKLETSEKCGIIDVNDSGVRIYDDFTNEPLGVKSVDFMKSIQGTNFDNPAVVDKRAISQGSTNIGSGETYTTRAQFCADLANLTGDLTATITSDITETATSNVSIDFGGYDLTITSSDDHLGNPNSGWTIEENHFGEGIYLTCSGSGNFINENHYTKRTGNISSALAGWLDCSQSSGSVKVIVRDMLIDGNSKRNTGIDYHSSVGTIEIYDCKFWNFVDASSCWGIMQRSAAVGGQMTIENVAVYNCYQGINFNNLTSTVTNTVVHSCTNDDWVNLTNVTGTNCAHDSAGSIGFTTESGTVSSINDADFASVDDTNALFLDIVSGSDLKEAGTDGSISGHTTDIRDVAWVSGSWSIGPHSFVELPANVNESISVAEFVSMQVGTEPREVSTSDTLSVRERLTLLMTAPDPYLLRIEDSFVTLIDGIRRKDGYHYNWGDSNVQDYTRINWRLYNASAVVEWVEEINVDTENGAHSNAYTNEALFRVYVRVPMVREKDNPLFEMRRRQTKALYDLKRLFAEYDQLDGLIDHIQYETAYQDDETQGDVKLPYMLVTEWRVYYIQWRTRPGVNAP